MDLIIQSLDRPSLQECRSCRLCNRNLQIPPEPYLCSYTSTALRLRDQASHTHAHRHTHTHTHTHAQRHLDTHTHTHTHTQEVVAIFPTLSHTAEISGLCFNAISFSGPVYLSDLLQSYRFLQATSVFRRQAHIYTVHSICQHRVVWWKFFVSHCCKCNTLEHTSVVVSLDLPFSKHDTDWCVYMCVVSWLHLLDSVHLWHLCIL